MENMSRRDVNASPHRLPQRELEAVFFLGDSLVQAEQVTEARHARIIDILAEAAGMPTFRVQPWYRNLTHAGAIHSLETPQAKRFTLMVLSLLLKTDVKDRPGARAYFTRVRQELLADPITVPADIEAHKQRVLAYLNR